MSAPSKLTIIKLGGKLLRDLNLLRDGLSKLMPAFKLTQEKFIFVHGGGECVDQWLRDLGHPVVKKQGLRVTPREQMPVICGALSGYSNKALVGAFSQLGVNAIGLCLSDAQTFVAKPYAPEHQLGRVAGVEPNNIAFLKLLIHTNVVPVMSSIALDEKGDLYNVNADHAAIAIAEALNADKLVFLSDQDGVLNASGKIEQLVDGVKANGLIESGAVINGMKVKLETAMRASKSLSAPAHIANGFLPATWQKIAARQHVGTTVIGY